MSNDTLDFGTLEDHTSAALTVLEGALSHLGALFMRAGSQVTCDPPPPIKDSDVDVLVREFDGVYPTLEGLGYTLDKGEDYDFGDAEAFHSYSNGHVNVIVCILPEFYERFAMATRVCTKLNLLEKEKRVTLFKALLYNEE